MKKLKINKKVAIIVSAVLGVLVLAGAITATVLYIRNSREEYEEQIMYKQGQIDSLTAQIAEIGNLTTVFELKYDVLSGTIIDAQDLVPVQVPEKSAAGFITDINEAVGKRYKTFIQKGDLLTDSLVYPNDLKGDLRYIYVTLSQVPIDLKVGDYIDIRFQFSMGQTFLAMQHKEVLGIYGNVVKIIGDAADEHVRKSMETDLTYYIGCKTYALQYVDGGVQEAGQVYYPLRYEEMQALVDDVNIPDDYDYEKYMAVNRDLYDAGLISKLRSTNNEVDEELATAIDDMAKEFEQSYQKAQEVYQAQQSGGTVNGISSGSSGGDGGFGVMN